MWPALSTRTSDSGPALRYVPPAHLDHDICAKLAVCFHTRAWSQAALPCTITRAAGRVVDRAAAMLGLGHLPSHALLDCPSPHGSTKPNSWHAAVQQAAHGRICRVRLTRPAATEAPTLTSQLHRMSLTPQYTMTLTPLSSRMPTRSAYDLPRSVNRLLNAALPQSWKVTLDAPQEALWEATNLVSRVSRVS